MYLLEQETKTFLPPSEIAVDTHCMYVSYLFLVSTLLLPPLASTVERQTEVCPPPFEAESSNVCPTLSPLNSTTPSMARTLWSKLLLSLLPGTWPMRQFPTHLLLFLPLGFNLFLVLSGQVSSCSRSSCLCTQRCALVEELDIVFLVTLGVYPSEATLVTNLVCFKMDFIFLSRVVISSSGRRVFGFLSIEEPLFHSPSILLLTFLLVIGVEVDEIESIVE